MKIEHIAIWTERLEELKDFYIRYFDARPDEKYVNPKKGFESYFLWFDDGCRLELMKMPGIPSSLNNIKDQFQGIIHIALSVGSISKVDQLTQQLEQDGYQVIDGPRTTGDGYYESVILDPDNNRVEIKV